jgi:predicted AAA+ superfamily ATPase
MIKRNLENNLVRVLRSSPVVVLLGARQVGETTLALGI